MYSLYSVQYGLQERVVALLFVVGYSSGGIASPLVGNCFEGSLHLFIFVWVPLLQEAASAPEDPPLGYIFSSFMLSMLLGALLYSSIVSRSPLDTHEAHEGDSPSPSLQILMLSVHAKISAGILVASALTFLAAVGREDEHMRFWIFCVFEMCVGIYYPVQGMLRGRLVSDEHRATVSHL